MNHSSAPIWILLDSSGMGGIETHVLILAAALRDAGHATEVLFLTDHGPHPLHAQLDRMKLSWRVLDGSLAQALREPPPALLHTHGYKAGILGRIQGRKLGIPTVSTYHAGEPGTGMVWVYNKLDVWTSWLAPSIAVNQKIADRLMGSARVIDNFVQIPPATQLGNAGQTGTVAFVGRLSHEKGPDIFCQLAESLPNIDFQVFGDGPERTKLEPQYGDKVRFHGMADMNEHWPDIGLLCMPSRHEGLPMAALEAMARGIPVAAFEVGALPKLIRNDTSGWIAPPEDIEALAAGIKQWDQNRDTETGAQVRAAARRTVKNDYGPEAGVLKVLKVYRKAGYPR